MIRRVLYKDIDFEKYEQCIRTSVVNTFYVQKSTLDFFCDDWELLVYDDYKSVMPIPLKKKYLLKFIAMPVFCQQLGILGLSNEVLNKQFLNKLVKNYNILTYSFNQNNTFKDKLITRKNYVIPRQNYTDLKKKYSKGRKSVLKNIKNLSFVVAQMSDLEEQFISNNFKGLKNDTEVQKFITFIRQRNNQLKIFQVQYFDKIICVAVIVSDQFSNGLLALINDENYKELNASSYLIDTFLRDEIENKDFDFMGSNHRGIEIFFKSFGASLRTFNYIENSKFRIVKKALRLT